MAQLRGGQKIWDAVAVDAADSSQLAGVGTGPNVCVYIQNDDTTDATFDIEVASMTTPSAGRNALGDATLDEDAGLTWFPLNGAKGLAVAAGDRLAFDLSPFSPPFLRLVRKTGAVGDGTITAFVSSEGGN